MLATKLVAPRPPPVTVRRPRLLDAVDAGVRGPLTLVAAPAGSGKTALVAAWVAEGRAPGKVAWLSLGVGENSRRSFWSAAVAALHPALGQTRALALTPRVRIETLLTALVDALGGAGKPVTLVLDDFHEVDDPLVMADVQNLLDHGPGRLRLVLLTRSDPSVRLERLRVAGRLSEIRAQDLAFTRDEAGELYEALNLALTDEDLDALCRRTEGWAAGLRLAALSLEGLADPHAFVEGFAGDDRAVSDYVMSEVISRLDHDTLAFLLRTCIVDRVNGDLADAVTEVPGGADALAALTRRDGLVTPLSSSRGWYRYHPLFSEVLRIELGRSMPGDIAALHRRAALWYRTHGESRDAIQHAIQAADWDLTAEVVGEHWLQLVVDGEGQDLRDVMDRIPDEVVRGNAELALASAGLEFDAGHADVDDLLEIAASLAPEVPEPRRRQFALCSSLMRLYRARIGGDAGEALRAARAELGGNWERSLSADVRALTLSILGTAEYWADELSSSLRHLQEAAGLARQCGNDYLLLGAQAWAAAAALRSDQLAEAHSRAADAVEIAELRGWTGTAGAAVAYVTLAVLALLANDQARAIGLLGQAKATSMELEPLLALEIAWADASLIALRGEALAALDVLRAATGGANGRLPRFLAVSTAMLEADLLLMLGEPARARRVLADLGTEQDAPDAAIGIAQVELALGAPEAAIRSIATFLADDRNAVQLTARVGAWTLDAIGRDELRDEEGALRALERALDVAEPRGFVWPIARHGAPVRSLLRRLVRRGTAHRALADEVLAALDGNGGAPGQPSRPLLEPLTERELAVLRFLPTMMSNGEIASAMFVSVNTVKTHLKHVYRKLDVTDRREAVRRGRELHLLNPGLAEH